MTAIDSRAAGAYLFCEYSLCAPPSNRCSTRSAAALTPFSENGRFALRGLLLSLQQVQKICLNLGVCKFWPKVFRQNCHRAAVRFVASHTKGVSEIPMGTWGMSYAQVPSPAGLRRDPASHPVMTPKVYIESLVTVRQAAKLLNITPAAIHKAIKRGRLPCLKLGRVFVIQRADLIRYRKTKSVGGRPKKQADETG